jgi:hypothetical protein
MKEHVTREYHEYINISALTWYVLSKLSYINLVISDVFPTTTQKYGFKNPRIIWALWLCQKWRSLNLIIDRTGAWHIKWSQVLPLCSPRKTSLNFLRGLPKSEAIFFAFPATVFSSKLYYGIAGNRLKIVYLVISATLMEFDGAKFSMSKLRMLTFQY